MGFSNNLFKGAAGISVITYFGMGHEYSFCFGYSIHF
jgi:hypothetical protein